MRQFFLLLIALTTGCFVTPAPPSCRTANETCEVTADCCNPLVCIQGSCQAQTVECGDNKCSGSENSNTCCEDCGCPIGAVCNNGITCTTVGISTLDWTIADECYNGEEIEFRFFDITDGSVWPNLSQVYVLDGGTSSTYSLDCTTGDQICFGGGQPVHGLYWGLDSDGSRSCSSCCFSCSNASVFGIDGNSLTCF
jgi:hypothetical protein